ncbi:MAG: class I SAM-dependent methyltransferase [Chloroflexi bacterium]|nr:class I SAM-dependent methyltransferase [Chloroflexota bacterium]
MPRMFDPWAERLLDLVRPEPGEAALDVACGPGTVARQLARRLGPTGRVVGADFSAAMLDVARRKTREVGAATIEYIQCDAGELRVPHRTFDLITCQHGFQFFPDQPRALAEMLRVLKPGGRVGLATWVGLPMPLRAFRQRVEELGGQPVRVEFSDDPAELARCLRDAGFQGVAAATHRMDLDWGSAEEFIGMLPATPFYPSFTALTETQQRDAMAVLRAELARHEHNGTVSYLSVANIAVGFSGDPRAS